MLDKFWDARTFRILFTTLIFLLVLGFLHAARATLTLFLLSVLFAYFLEPLAARLEKPIRSRLGAIAVVYAILAVVLTVLGFIFGPRIATESKALMLSFPTMLNEMASGQFISRFGSAQNMSTAHQHQLQYFFMTHKAAFLRYGTAFAARLETPLARIWWLVLIPILSFFFLQAGPKIGVAIVDLGKSHDEKGTLSGIVQDLNVMVGSYIRAQLLLAALTAVVLTIVLSLMRVPYAIVLGPIAGLFEIIPVVGPAVACTIIWGLGLLLGYGHEFYLFLFLGSWRIIQDYVSAPRIMGSTLEINPLATIFGVLAGGEIGGVIGALVAVPIIAMLRIFWRRLIDEPANKLSPTQPRASQLPDKPRA